MKRHFLGLILIQNEIKNRLKVTKIITMKKEFPYKVIHVRLYNLVHDIMKHQIQWWVICFSSIGRHTSIEKGSPWSGESRFVPIFVCDKDLVVIRESIHERHNLETNHSVNNEINDGKRKIIICTSGINVVKIETHPHEYLFFQDKDDVWHHRVFT